MKLIMINYSLLVSLIMHTKKNIFLPYQTKYKILDYGKKNIINLWKQLFKRKMNHYLTFFLSHIYLLIFITLYIYTINISLFYYFNSKISQRIFKIFKIFLWTKNIDWQFVPHTSVQQA